jgi:hypothetical protein
MHIGKHVFHPLLVFAVTILSTLLLLCGALLLHHPDFVQVAHVQAAITCASSAGTQTVLCEGQDPQIQGCTHDEQLMENESVYTARSTLIGSVSLLHSPTCRTSWVRTTALARIGAPQVMSIEAHISFSTGRIAISKVMVPTRGASLNSPMQFVPLKVVPTNWTGVFSLRGATAPIMVPLYASTTLIQQSMKGGLC